MILITGATGYVGRHLVARLVEKGERPRCLVRDSRRAASILPADKVEFAQGDTTNPASLEAAVRGIDTIVHAAFITADHKQTTGNQYETTNVQGTTNLIQAAKAAGVRRMIEISGLGTKPAKPGSYMQGRYLAEKMLKESGLDWTIIQPSVLFGKDAPFIKGLADLIRTSPVVPLIGGGPAYYSFTQIIDALMRAMHKIRIKAPAPTSLVGLGSAVMELVLPKPPLTTAAMTLFSFDNTTDLQAVERDFGFTPMSFTKYLDEHGV